ncbi:MAG: glycosyltransferase [Caldicoprobacterales bacterium]
MAGEWLFGKNAEFTILKNSLDTKMYLFDEDKRAIVREKLNISEKFVIGHIGRFHVQKNHEFLIEIFRHIVNMHSGSILLLIGEGHLRDNIEQKVKFYNLQEKIKFLGVRSDVPDLLQAMDVFLFPSLFEGFPNVLAEAQAAGLRCVASDRITDSIKITDLIEFLSLEESSEKWAKEVLKYKDGYIRRDTSNEIIRAGYDNDHNIKWLEDFYLEHDN